MNRAATIFRSFFAEGKLGTEDHDWFVLKHRLELIEVPSWGHAVCTRRDRHSQPQSHEGKPAFVLVFDVGVTYFLVEWTRDKLLHREDGPAQVIAYRSGRVIGNWYENGVQTAGPLALKDEYAVEPLPLTNLKKPKGPW